MWVVPTLKTTLLVFKTLIYGTFVDTCKIFCNCKKWKYNWQAPCDTSVLEFSSAISKKQANTCNNRENSGSKSTSIYLELNIQQRIWPCKNTEGIAKDTFDSHSINTYRSLSNCTRSRLAILCLLTLICYARTSPSKQLNKRKNNELDKNVMWKEWLTNNRKWQAEGWRIHHILECTEGCLFTCQAAYPRALYRHTKVSHVWIKNWNNTEACWNIDEPQTTL